MDKVGNLSLSISLEGYEEVNDGRRGEGVYDKVMEAMDSLMSKTDCLATDPSNDSPYRSFYYDAKSYTGLTLVTKIASKAISMSETMVLPNATNIFRSM